MSNEQKDATVEQKKEALALLALLEAEARRVSWAFCGELGDTLRASPENVFESQIQSVDARYYSPAGNSRVYKSDEGSERVFALTSKIRSTRLRVADLSEQVSQLEKNSVRR
jgi:hypothetical protein